MMHFMMRSLFIWSPKCALSRQESVFEIKPKITYVTNRRLYFPPDAIKFWKSPHTIASYTNVIMATIRPRAGLLSVCLDISGKGFSKFNPVTRNKQD